MVLLNIHDTTTHMHTQPSWTSSLSHSDGRLSAHLGAVGKSECGAESSPAIRWTLKHGSPCTLADSPGHDACVVNEWSMNHWSSVITGVVSSHTLLFLTRR